MVEKCNIRVAILPEVQDAVYVTKSFATTFTNVCKCLATWRHHSSDCTTQGEQITNVRWRDGISAISWYNVHKSCSSLRGKCAQHTISHHGWLGQMPLHQRDCSRRPHFAWQGNFHQPTAWHLATARNRHQILAKRQRGSTSDSTVSARHAKPVTMKAIEKQRVTTGHVAHAVATAATGAHRSALG